MGNLGSLLTILLVLATFNETLIENLLGRWKNPFIDSVLVYVSLLLGIAEAFAFNINGLSLLGIQNIVVPEWVGILATGAVLGSGSGVIHKFMGSVGVGRPS